jgi:uroporphyrinogen decarboxylase
MIDRERFHKALLFGSPDRVPFEPGWPRESTLKAWHQQGLPPGCDWRDFLWQVLDMPEKPPPLSPDLGVSFKLIPAFEEKVLEHRAGHLIIQDWMGAITEISDEYDFTYIRSARDFVTRKWHAFPVKSRQDWVEKIQWRYSTPAEGRFPSDFEARCQALRRREGILDLTIPGPFWQLREWCGFETLCTLFIEEPGFVQEMIDYWGSFVLRTLDPLLSRIELDAITFSEDMAYKLHSMISPRMVRQFILPTYRKWVAAIRASGCPIISVDSDGYVGELIPIWIEAGFNCCTPVEVAAGNDIVDFRQRFGRSMAFMGGIDKRALAAGGETLQAEVLRVVPPLLREGGFIPGCDHGVPPDISWENFVDYSQLLAQLTGWL